MTFPSFSVGEVLTAADMNAVGLWKVASGTLSLTTDPINVTGVFSSDYKNYRVLLNCTARTNPSRFDMRYIVGTTPTSANYFQGGIASDFASNTTLYMQRSNNDDRFYGQNGALDLTMTIDIFNPNRAAQTVHSGQLVNSSSAVAYSFGGVQQSTTAQFTGFQLFNNTGTATVEYQVFGYRD